MMKIAVVTDDGLNISQHFGRARYYVVFTTEGKQITSRENRAKAGHHCFAEKEHAHITTPGRHGCDFGSAPRHDAMAESIGDCQVLLAGGMGWGAYESMKGHDIETIVTDLQNMDRAMELYLKGELPNLTDRLH